MRLIGYHRSMDSSSLQTQILGLGLHAAAFPTRAPLVQVGRQIFVHQGEHVGGVAALQVRTDSPTRFDWLRVCIWVVVFLFTLCFCVCVCVLCAACSFTLRIIIIIDLHEGPEYPAP